MSTDDQQLSPAARALVNQAVVRDRQSPAAAPPITFYAEPAEPPLDLIPAERQVDIVDAEGRVLGRATLTTGVSRAEAEERRQAELADARRAGALRALDRVAWRRGRPDSDGYEVRDIREDILAGRWKP